MKIQVNLPFRCFLRTALASGKVESKLSSTCMTRKSQLGVAAEWNDLWYMHTLKNYLWRFHLFCFFVFSQSSMIWNTTILISHIFRIDIHVNWNAGHVYNASEHLKLCFLQCRHGVRIKRISFTLFHNPKLDKDPYFVCKDQLLTKV